MVYGWCYSKYSGWGYCFLYYKMLDFIVQVSQINIWKRFGYYAGIMLRGRGRHLKLILHSGRSY